MSDKKIRVLMSKPGIDGHWRGGIVVSRALRDAGMELILTTSWARIEVKIVRYRSSRIRSCSCLHRDR